MSKGIRIIILALFAGLLCLAGWLTYRFYSERQILKKIVERLEGDSRAAEMVVTSRQKDPDTGVVQTTIKFLEYDSCGLPLAPQFFTFSGDIIQFQSLVIRFDDRYVEAGHPFKGKSAYLFMKVFSLDNGSSEVFEITPIGEIPEGYKVSGSRYEKKLWERFWTYALDREAAGKEGIKNAQIEAPGSKFLPGYIYTLLIEHDGGLRIDAQKVPAILRN